MRVFASSFGAWKQIEEVNRVKEPHGLVFPLAVLAAIGRPYGLEMVAEEHTQELVSCFDAVFISVLDSRCMIDGGKHFRAWGMPLRRQDRDSRWPLVWAGGQGLHNPLPMADIYDLVVVGDAETPLPLLLEAWEEVRGDRERFLDRAAGTESVYVPSRHILGRDRIRQSVADDISVTLRENVKVSHNGQRRVEIARGCRYKCAFCSLGWRAPVRENTGDDVAAVIKASPKIVHLQAGDAESHSEIGAIRRALHEHGGRDNGWTGRLDTTLANPDARIPGTKRYAFGVEGVSARLRSAVGKGYLTDKRLVRDTIDVLQRVEGDFYGRAAWHLISGLPTERAQEVQDIKRVVREIDARMPGLQRRNLSLHWQPFQPLPGTPMQWFGCGGGVLEKAKQCKDLERLTKLRITQETGRRDYMAAATTILSRATPRGGAAILEAVAGGVRVSITELREMGEATELELSIEQPLLWDAIEYAYARPIMERAFRAVVRRLTEPDIADEPLVGGCSPLPTQHADQPITIEMYGNILRRDREATRELSQPSDGATTDRLPSEWYGSQGR